MNGLNGVKEFKTKKGLLEYLGKKGNDNKLVDRMIMRGEVRKENGMYYIVERDEEYNGLSIQQLVMELEVVKKEKSELEADYIKWIQEHPAGRGVDKNNNNNKVNTLTEVSDSELLGHLGYLYDMVEKKNSFIDEVVQQFFNKNRMSYDYDGAREECYKIFKYVEDLNEQDELEYVKDIIGKR